MEKIMKLSEIINLLSESFDIPYLQLDAKDRYRLIFDQLEVYCFEASGKFHWYANVCELPQEKHERQAVIRVYMQLVLAYLKRYPVSLTIEEGHLGIFYQLNNRNLDYPRFEVILEEFLNALEFFRQYDQVEAPQALVVQAPMMLRP